MSCLLFCTLYCSDSACNCSRTHNFIMEHRQKKRNKRDRGMELGKSRQCGHQMCCQVFLAGFFSAMIWKKWPCSTVWRTPLSTTLTKNSILNWVSKQNRVTRIIGWSFQNVCTFSLSKLFIDIWKDMQIILYMAQLPTYTDLAWHAFNQTRVFLNSISSKWI